MSLIAFAMRRPISVVTAMLALLGAGGFAVSRMKVDIFPALNLPVVYVCQPYGGMDPAQMEGLIANYYEYHFLYINGIHHVESKNVQGTSLMRLFFHPGTNMAQAMAEVVGYVNRSRAFMPPGTVPPFIMRFDTGSVPVGYLVLSSETKSVGEIQDQALFKVRPMFASLPGVSAPPPFGGSARTVVVRADPNKLRAYNVSADDVVQALSNGNAIGPSGAIRTIDAMPVVPSNSLVVKPSELGQIAVKPGVFLQDVAPVIEDASDIATGYALVDGRRAVYILVTKRADASTLDVVENVRRNLPKMQAVLPDDIRASFEFDQSPYVTNAMTGVVAEGLMAAALVAAAVMLFLRDWRSVLIVVLNIPLALAGSIIALAICGHTINLMTLGGLALAVGILVDEALVEIENFHSQLSRVDSVPLAVRRGNSETATPRLLAMCSILAVFAPVFLMQGAIRELFVPLALAVGFAMICSYFLSNSLVPVLAAWVLRKGGRHAMEEASVGGAFHRLTNWTSRQAKTTVLAYAIAVGVVLALCIPLLGTEIFPRVDAGFFQLRLRAPTGTRIEQTEAIVKETLRFARETAGEGVVERSLGYVGLIPPSFPINAVYTWMGGPEEAAVRIALRRGSLRVDELQRRLREKLPEHLAGWIRDEWVKQGVPSEYAERKAKEVRLSFEPADVVNEVMSFGSATPVEVVVSGPKFPDNRAHADKVRAELAKIGSLRDLQFVQSLDYPTVDVQIDRYRAAASGVTPAEVSRSLLAATASSRFVVPNYWRDPASGVGYQVQVEIPQAQMKSATDVETVPVKQGSDHALLLRDVADVQVNAMPGEIDRYNMRRIVSITANIAGADLGRVASEVQRAVAAAGKPPQGVEVDVRGQIAPMNEMLRGLAFGLLLSVVCIFLLLTAYFQSVRLALVAVSTAPAVLAGIAAFLLATNTTVNLQSFMGAITALGVSLANSILVVSFAERERRAGRSAEEAAAIGAGGRTRAILMTASAMIVGMLPLAFGFGEGSEQTAPLGRAVIGGLLLSTAATQFVLPAVFALLMRNASTASPSLDPYDPTSSSFVETEANA